MIVPRHKRLSIALCEAVEFGSPTLIRMGMDDWFQLLASIDKDGHKVDLANDRFENVPVQRDHNLRGCYVEHDSRYVGLSIDALPTAIPETVAVMRDSRKPCIVAWEHTET